MEINLQNTYDADRVMKLRAIVFIHNITTQNESSTRHVTNYHKNDVGKIFFSPSHYCSFFRLQARKYHTGPSCTQTANNQKTLSNNTIKMKYLTKSEVILSSALLCATGNAFILPQKQLSTTFVQKATISPSLLDPSFTPPDAIGEGEITEQACANAAAKMKRVKVPVPDYVSSSGDVGVSFVHWEAEKKTNALPIILVHGFDSSCLEYRRLGPKLAALGIDTYAVDLLGWGYSQLEDVNTFSAQAKVDALSGFWEVVGNGKPVCVAGASLGGAAAIEFAAAYPDVVKGCVFIDAQGFIDGTGPMAMLPKFLAEAGVQVLKSIPLRNAANKMSYYDKDTFATEDALKIGRLHCLQDGWSDALVSFMLSGGFSPSAKVPTIESPSLILWGRQDNILEMEFAQKFIDTLPSAELRWVEECGHVPHLEQSEVTAEEIANFLLSDKFESIDDSSTDVFKMITDAFAQISSK